MNITFKFCEMKMNDMLRLFICIWIPEEMKQKILRFQEKLKNLPINAKFVEKENLHLTITFLGDVNESEINILKSKLDNLKGFGEFHVKLNGLRVIPSENYIRVIGIDVVDEKNKLKELIKNVGSNIGGSFHDQTKMTLCRVKSVKNKNEIKSFIELNKNLSIGEFIVDKIFLVKSTLTRDGPVYETVHEVSLSK